MVGTLADRMGTISLRDASHTGSHILRNILGSNLTFGLGEKIMDGGSIYFVVSFHF
jgi:hypothetical protein